MLSLAGGSLYDSSEGINLHDITYSVSLNVDPVFNIFGSRTWFGLTFSVLSLFRLRGVPGQNIVVPYAPSWQFWVGAHLWYDYLQGLSNSPSQLESYTYQTVPFAWLTYIRIWESVSAAKAIWIKVLGWVCLLLASIMIIAFTPLAIIYALVLKVRGII